MPRVSDEFLLTTAPPEIVNTVDFCYFLEDINALSDPIEPYSAWEVTLITQYELEVEQRYGSRAIIGFDGRVCCFDRPLEYRN